MRDVHIYRVAKSGMSNFVYNRFSFFIDGWLIGRALMVVHLVWSVQDFGCGTKEDAVESHFVLETLHKVSVLCILACPDMEV